LINAGAETSPEVTKKKFPLMGISYIDLPFKYAPYRYFKWVKKIL
jgi:hypothetical protein